MDKIDMKNLRDEPCHRLLVSAAAKVMFKDGKKDDKFMKYWNNKKDHTMKLVIDDEYELSVREVMAEWDKQIDRAIDERAQTLIDNKMVDIWDEVEVFTEELKDSMKEILKKAKDKIKAGGYNG